LVIFRVQLLIYQRVHPIHIPWSITLKWLKVVYPIYPMIFPYSSHWRLLLKWAEFSTPRLEDPQRIQVGTPGARTTLQGFSAEGPGPGRSAWRLRPVHEDYYTLQSYMNMYIYIYYNIYIIYIHNIYTIWYDVYNICIH